MNPLEQSLLGAHLPLLLRSSVDAPLPDGAIIISVTHVASVAWSRHALTQLLQDPRVLLNLSIKIKINSDITTF